MGLSSGTEIAVAMIDAIQSEVPRKSTRKNLYYALYECLLAADWDTVDEAMGIDDAFDEVVAEDEEDCD